MTCYFHILKFYDAHWNELIGLTRVHFFAMLHCVDCSVASLAHHLLHNPLFARRNHFPQFELLLINIEDHLGSRISMASLPSHWSDQLSSRQSCRNLRLRSPSLTVACAYRCLYRESNFGAAVRPVVAVLVDCCPVLSCWRRFYPPTKPVLLSTTSTIVNSSLLVWVDLLPAPCPKFAVAVGRWSYLGRQVCKNHNESSLEQDYQFHWRGHCRNADSKNWIFRQRSSLPNQFACFPNRPYLLDGHHSCAESIGKSCLFSLREQCCSLS